MGSDKDIGMNRNSSDWLGMNSYPILSPGYLLERYHYGVVPCNQMCQITSISSYRFHSTQEPNCFPSVPCLRQIAHYLLKPT